MKTLARSMVAALFLVAVGCGGGDDTSNPDAPAAGPDASTEPSVAATAAPDTLAAGADTMVTITVMNFTLEAPTGQPNADGHGHYHIYLDNETGANYLVADSVSPVTVTIPAGTTAGAHTLKVELFNNDHTELTTPVSTTVDITVQ